MTPDELREHVAADRIDTVIVAFADHYGRLLGKRLDARHFCDEVLLAGTHACDYLLTTDMEMNPVAGYAAASWRQGYGDHHVVPDLGTLRPAGWADATAVVFADLETATGPVEVAPRAVLRRQVDRLAAAGYAAEAASELECFVVDRSYRDLAADRYGAPDGGHRTVGWYVEDYHLLAGARVEPYLREVRRSLARSEIPVEGTKGEAGRGQQELNVAHCDVTEMADRHALAKHAMKEVADRRGLAVTFMAKPWSDDAGSSGHLHLSLWNRERTTNVFAGDGALGESDVFRWFLGGWMAHLRDLMVCFAPTVNSYKRFAADSWAHGSSPSFSV